MIRLTIQLAKWLSVLVIGLIAISMLVYSSSAAGSGAGTGFFSYRFGAVFQVWPNASGDASGSFRVEGNVAPRFLLWGHTSPAYQTVAIEWEMYHGNQGKGQASLDLEQMGIVAHDQTTDITEKSLSTLLGFSTANPREAEQVATLLSFLESARDGTLPPPRHHGYALPEPLPGYMQHFATGTSIPPLQLIWVIVWSAIGLGASVRRRAARRHVVSC